MTPASAAFQKSEAPLTTKASVGLSWARAIAVMDRPRAKAAAATDAFRIADFMFNLPFDSVIFADLNLSNAAGRLLLKGCWQRKNGAIPAAILDFRDSLAVRIVGFV
ncbi:hypothetical protein BQ8482_110357 [Mesorhizobium delmotii]|uniref:Uncharacterized protein n=1 Tax=Mesorhizobium delmotii TaxID=1631247 RepID=A0A2P9ABC9_9HYPH|nr:hypothetical protein BQ8482_110357 [Mesorhizobium delmotii]